MIKESLYKPFGKRSLGALRRQVWCARFALLLCGILLHVPFATPDVNHALRLSSLGSSRDAQANLAWLHALDKVQAAWEPVQTLHWFGQPVWLRHFTLSKNLGQATSQFIQETQGLNRMLTGPHTVLLSGMANGVHRVIHMQAGSHGVTGLASVLDGSLSGTQPFVHPSAYALTGLALDAPLHHSAWTLPDGARVQQSIYGVAQSPVRLGERLRRVLPRQGWKEAASLVASYGAQWQRGRQHLHVVPNRNGHGSLLYQLWVD